MIDLHLKEVLKENGEKVYYCILKNADSSFSFKVDARTALEANRKIKPFYQAISSTSLEFVEWSEIIKTVDK